MIKVCLWTRDTFLGIIVPCASGVTWSQELSQEPRDDVEIEGVYIPLDPDLKWAGTSDPLYGKGCQRPAPGAIQEFLDAFDGLKSQFAAPATEDTILLPMGARVLHAGWVPVVVRDHGNYPKARAANELMLAEGIEGRLVVLVYSV